MDSVFRFRFWSPRFSATEKKTYRVYNMDYSRLHVNCLKTVLVIAADSYMAHIWQYPHPTAPEYFLPLHIRVLITKIITDKDSNPVHFFQAFFSQLLKLRL